MSTEPTIPEAVEVLRLAKVRYSAYMLRLACVTLQDGEGERDAALVEKDARQKLVNYLSAK